MPSHRSSTPQYQYGPGRDVRAAQVQSAINSGHVVLQALQEDELADEIIMAVDVQGGKTVGCAYYVGGEQRLLLMQDVEASGPDIIETLKLSINPTIVLVPQRIDTPSLEVLDAQHATRTEDTLPYRIEYRSNAEFSFDTAINRLSGLLEGSDVTLLVPGEVMTGEELTSGQVSRQSSLLRLACWIDVDSRLTVGCAGAVLSCLQRRQEHVEATIESFTLEGSMLVNTDTLLSLQIMQSEIHPHLHSQAGKEGLSVYGLFHHFAKTPQGRTLLRQSFLRPSTQLEIIEERHNTIATLLRAENIDCVAEVHRYLRGVKNMRQVLIKLRKGVHNVWHSLREFAFSVLNIRDAMKMITGQSILCEEVCALNADIIALVGRMITNIIDFEQSTLQGRTVILPGIDEELDDVKRTYDGLEDLLSQVADDVAQDVPAVLDAQLNVIFFPQIGFLIAIRLDPQTSHGVYECADWEEMFTTQEYAYYKSDKVKQMDAHLGDVYGQICDKEIEITQGLAEKVLEHEGVLSAVSDLCGSLDSMLALAQGAKQYKLVRPRMTEENMLEIRGARHVLQEMTVATFVPNDIQIGPRVTIVTGPNYSGKSIYLLQTALITFLAHVGSFVPAEEAIIGITDKILTRIATRESVSRGQSTFMIDLQQMCVALRLATARSLLVVDEFGKGTDSSDGIGLGAGVIQHLLHRGSECPKVLVATHFHELGGFLDSPLLGFGMMEIRQDSDRVTYLYNYRAGRSKSSHGTCCARLNGIAEDVVARAEELIEMMGQGDDLVAACAVVSVDERERLEAAEKMARNFLQADLGDARMALGGILST